MGPAVLFTSPISPWKFFASGASVSSRNSPTLYVLKLDTRPSNNEANGTTEIRYVQSKRDQRNGRMNGVIRSTISITTPPETVVSAFKNADALTLSHRVG